MAPHTDMKPVLLKPNTDIGAQVHIHSQAIGIMDARLSQRLQTDRAAVLARLSDIGPAETLEQAMQVGRIEAQLARRGSAVAPMACQRIRHYSVLEGIHGFTQGEPVGWDVCWRHGYGRDDGRSEVQMRGV